MERVLHVKPCAAEGMVEKLHLGLRGMQHYWHTNPARLVEDTEMRRGGNKWIYKQ